MTLPAEARPLLNALAPVFTQPTFHRFVILLGSAILCTGRRTVANLLRTAEPLAEGHRTTYQRVLSSAEWSAADTTSETDVLWCVRNPSASIEAASIPASRTSAAARA